MMSDMWLSITALKVKYLLESHERVGERDTVESGSVMPITFPLSPQMSIIHLIIYYHVIGRKFNKLLRALENQYLLNAVYV